MIKIAKKQNLPRQAAPTAAQRRAVPSISSVWSRVIANWRSIANIISHYNLMRDMVVGNERRIALLEKKLAKLEKKKK